MIPIGGAVRQHAVRRLLAQRAVHDAVTPEGTAQRTRRPLSPHLTIYQPQLTWVMSIGHRVTGAGVAVLIYGFGAYYAVVQPGAITETVREAVAVLPGAVVATGKFLLAAPFFFHTFNGVRHLVWDSGRALSLRATYLGGWAVNAASIAAAAAVTAIW